jgi:HAE1 family hydrophobic/amphiphilic exporter-1
MKIIAFSIRRPVTVTMLFLALTVFGVVSYEKLTLNLLPDISYPTLTIRTEMEGTAPEEVETLISKLIENSVSVVENVVEVSSISKSEVSDVVVEFSWNTNMDFAALAIREQLDLVELPLAAEKPILLRFDPSMDPIMRVGASGSTNLSMMRYLSEEFIKADLESIQGVAAVRVSGGLEREIYVELDEQILTTMGISIQEVTTRLGQENINLTGGTLRDGESKYLVRTLNEFQNVDEINEVIIAQRSGVPIRVSDIGRVFSGFQERDIITRINGQESVELAVFKAADANTVSVAQAVKKRLTKLEQDYKGRRDPLEFKVVFDQSSFIKQSIDEVLQTAIYGGILAIVILLVFLRSITTTLIIGLSIPISIVTTFFLMYVFRVSLNIMSLSGLALGIGMLVDNSIVVLESIYRYKVSGLPAREAANAGASEVGSAVIASTLTTVCVFSPIVFVEGVAGQLFADQALTVTFSLLASLLVAIMLIPMLSSLGNSRSPQRIKTTSTFFAAPPYLWVLSLALRFRAVAILVAIVLFSGSISLLTRLGSELIPEISQGEFFVDIRLPSGVPVEQTSRRLLEFESLLQESEPVETFYTIAGSGNESGVAAVEEQEHIGQILVRLKSGYLHDKEAQVMEDLRKSFTKIPGVTYKFSHPNLFSFKTPVEVVLQGYNLKRLKAYAERLKIRLNSVPGLRDLKVSTDGSNPEIQIRFDRRKLANYGFTVNQLAFLIRNKVQGEIPTEFNERGRRIDIRVRLEEKDRATVQNLRNLVINPGSINPMVLSSVAEISLQEGPAEIRRIGPQRVAIITGSIIDQDLQSVVNDIETEIAELRLPADFYSYVGGQSEEQAVAFKSMQFALLLAVFLVYLVMASQFESLVQPFIIMFAIPFAGIGVALALYATQQILNVVVLIGFIVLAGIVVNNAIVLLDLANQLRSQGEDKYAAIREACSIRLRPILMTTSTTILGLLPMALNSGQGSELRIPLAITVIGGLLTSTLLTLVLIPVLYTLIVRKKLP